MTDILELDPPHRGADPQGGLSFIVIAAVATFLLGSLWSPLGWIGGILTVWVCYFFRDPPRVTPLRDGLVVSPGRRPRQPHHHGRAARRARPAAGADDPRLGVHERVRLPREPHRRSPAASLQILYTPGLFLNAELDKASEDNERNALVIETGGTRDRRRADRRPRRPPHRLFRQDGRHARAPASASA